MADPLVNSIKLIVAVGSFVAKPGILSGLNSGVTILETAKKLIERPPPGIATLAGDLSQDARTLFDNFGRELPDDAEVLFAQMVEASLPDPRQIVADGMDARRIVATMLGRHTDREHRRPPMPDLFETITIPTIDRLLADKAFADDLTPTFMANVLGGLWRIETKIDDLPQAIVALLEDRGVIPSEARTVDLSKLIALAVMFGGAPTEQPDGILTFLRDKAGDLDRLSREIDALKGVSDRIDNIRLAAADAVSKGRLKEARSLLNDAREIQKDLLRGPLEANAAIMEKTAEIDLIEGNAEAAYKQFCDAADSFRAIDPLEAADRRDAYREHLYRHGLRYGGSALPLAIEIMQPALAAVKESDQPDRFGGFQNNLAISLSVQGTRLGGAAGADLLGQAVYSYRAALRVYSEETHPVERAQTSNNLAIALSDQGERLGGMASIDLLGKAISAYRETLRVFTEKAHPVEWAIAQNNLAIALRNRGSRLGGDEGTDLLRQAVDSYQAALRVHTEDTHPVDWATAQSNLAIALIKQSGGLDGAGRADLGRQAVDACHAALRVFTEITHPVDWAMTQNNLGNALGNQGTSLGGAAGGHLLSQAVDAFCAALRVRTEEAHPVDWANTQANLVEAEWALAMNATTANPRRHLEAALEHVAAALRVYDPEHMPYDHEKASRLRDEINAALAEVAAQE